MNLTLERVMLETKTRSIKQFQIPEEGHIRVHMMGECDKINEWLLHHGGTISGITPFVSYWKVSKETQMLFLLRWSCYQ